MKRMLAIVAALVLASPVQAAPAQAPLPNQPGRWAPRDECARLPGAAGFRARLAQAVVRRDANALVAMASPKIINYFGGEAGRPELRRRLAGTEGESLWPQLDALVGLGCARDGNSLVLPWFFQQDIGEDEDYALYLVTGANVPAYEVADSKSNVLFHVSWQLVDLSPNGIREGEKFQQVDLVSASHRRGYVETARLRSRGDYRLIAERHRGIWQITALVAGD